MAQPQTKGKYWLANNPNAAITNDVGIDFNGSSHDQLSLAASKGAAGDRIHITSAGGRWWVQGVTNDQDGWAVGTDSANT